jgi:SAM-dependent methyltransferase
MNLQDAITLIKHNDIAEKTNARWADLGCGSGLFTFALANLLQKGSSIYAVDKSPVSLKTLPNPHNITIHTKQMDFIKEPLPFNGLDGILMANSFHYVADKINFIAAAGKQLTNEGIFLLVEYDTDRPNPWVPYPVSRHLLQPLFAKAGYNLFIKLNEISSVYHTGNMYAAIVRK